MAQCENKTPWMLKFGNVVMVVLVFGGGVIVYESMKDSITIKSMKDSIKKIKNKINEKFSKQLS